MTPTRIAYAATGLFLLDAATGLFLLDVMAQLILGPEGVERMRQECRERRERQRPSLEFYEADH